MSISVKEPTNNKSEIVTTRRVTWRELKQIITADPVLVRAFGDCEDSTWDQRINQELKNKRNT